MRSYNNDNNNAYILWTLNKKKLQNLEIVKYLWGDFMLCGK